MQGEWKMKINCIVHKKHWKGAKELEKQLLSEEKTEEVYRYHQTFPKYEKTPLKSLKELAKYMGVQDIWVKDEASRFGLNAFKALGGSFAIGKYLTQKYQLGEKAAGFLELMECMREKETLTFVTATDGNHGRGVAWAARQFGQKSVVYMPKGSAPERLHNIQAENADTSITEYNYDNTVRFANAKAQENGWIVVQDTAWEGYEDIPTWIMQGYTTMAKEALEQLQGERPTHIFIQAGVGSLAAAVVGFFSNQFPEEKPVMVVVEPETAACFYETMEANDGERRCVGGDMKTIMAGLACGEPSTIALPILEENAEFYLSCKDKVAADGMRILGNPLPGDERVIAGESGASGFGAAMTILTDMSCEKLKKEMGIDEHSKLLFFNSEGATDRENYRRIVWEGKCSE